MELQLKHLAPYLPYRLNIIYMSSEIYSSSNIWEMEGLLRDNIYLKENRYPTDIFLVKPILRPMSDYDKFESDFDLSTDFYTSYIASNGQLACGNSGNYTYLSDMITVTDWLFENHFDIFGLIPAGLAIDINTINHETEAK